VGYAPATFSLSSFWWWAVEINRCNPTKKPSFPLGKGRFLFGATELMVNGACGVPPSYPISALATRTRPKTKKPSLYKVLLLNDDYTPMEFVVHVLKAFFQMDTDQATRVMIHVHQKGVGVCGIFTYEVAETKVTQVMDFALKNQHPLQCTLEKD
jgi:ATP-dependent Clp protease adaptor protein ClpS